jgi:hypothetical protein
MELTSRSPPEIYGWRVFVLVWAGKRPSQELLSGRGSTLCVMQCADKDEQLGMDE